MKKDQYKFKKTATKVRKINISPRISRGGICL